MSRARSHTRDDFDNVKDALQKLKSENRKLRKENSQLKKEILKLSNSQESLTEILEEYDFPEENQDVNKQSCYKCTSQDIVEIRAGKFLISFCKTCGSKKRILGF